MRTLLIAVGALLLAPGRADALPSFARDSGMPCVACHTTAFGPSLTPEGEAFKLRGYSLGGTSTRLPINALALASFTHTSQGQGGATPRGFDANDNPILDEAALIYAGPVAPRVGVLAELRYDGVSEEARLGNVDIRFAGAGDPAGYGYMMWGLSLNNSPSVQDLWNTSPAWSFPFAVSGVAPRPAAAPVVEGRLEHEVYGVSGYTVLYDYLYLELGGYRSLDGTLREVANAERPDRLAGTAPYWRVAGMLQSDRHAWRIGAFGMRARLLPGGERGVGEDHYLDFTYDATYSYRGTGRHVKLQLAYTQEAQELGASAALGLAQDDLNRLRSYRATGIVSMDRALTWTGSAFMIEGAPDAGLYPAAPVRGSASHQPDSAGAVLELAFDASQRLGPLMDLHYRLGVQLTHYDRFNGAHRDYDGSGRDASDNDTVFVYLRTAM